MKIVNYTEFLKLPCPVLYCEWQPSYCMDMCVKVENVKDIDGNITDFLYDSLSDNIETSDSYIVPGIDLDYSLDFYYTGRDGCGKTYVDGTCLKGEKGERLFWVYSKEDVKELVHKLSFICSN